MKAHRRINGLDELTKHHGNANDTTRKSTARKQEKQSLQGKRGLCLTCGPSILHGYINHTCADHMEVEAQESKETV